MKKSDRDKHLARIRKIEEKKKKKEGNGVSPTPSLSLEPSEDEPIGKLRIIYLAHVPRRDDVGLVGDVLAEMGKSSELAETAHNSGGKARLQVYMGYSKHEANELAWQLENAGARLVRC